MALLPPHYPNAVVALETKRSDEHGEEDFQTVATGVLLGFRIDLAEGNTPPSYAVYLVTNQHVVQDEILWARFNTGATSRRFELGLLDPAGQPLWTAHPDYDLTVTPINSGALAEAGAEFTFLTEDVLLDLNGMEAAGVAAGDDLYVLGFPMGIGGREKKYVVVRAGVIARVDAEITADTNGYLIDCVTFPGNSGGPVVLRPAVTAITGTTAVGRAHLIGIVSAYIPYIDVAVSKQTERTRITFEENSGLTRVVPIDAVNDLVQPKLAQMRAARAAQEASHESENGDDKPPTGETEPSTPAGPPVSGD